MSRIGKKPVEVPGGVKVSVADRRVTVQGPKGTLEFTHRPEVSVEVQDKSVSVAVGEELVGDRKVRALWGTTRALLSNMMIGVTKGYERRLVVVGVGWGAEVSGTKLRMKVGFANPIEFEIPKGLDVKVEKDTVVINGPDKQAVGQFAAMARGSRPPEPYQGKGVRYANEVVKKKEGKQFGK